MKKDPKKKSLFGQELLDLIEKRIQEYGITPQKGIIVDSSVRHIAQKKFIQDRNKEEMIKNYLEEVKRNLLLNITQYEKSDTSMRSETSDDVTEDIQEAQPDESDKPTSEDTLKNAEDFLRQLKKKDKITRKSDTSMRSETSDDVTEDIQEAQPDESEKPTSEDTLKNAEDFL
uniref:Uncharacterized protein n=1 Tax=Solanum tuberosum TaxID=4113 RepID=M1DU20_SOLTU